MINNYKFYNKIFFGTVFAGYFAKNLLLQNLFNNLFIFQLKKILPVVLFFISCFVFSQNTGFYIALGTQIFGIENVHFSKEQTTPEIVNTTPETNIVSGTMYVHNPKSFFAKDNYTFEIVLNHTTKEAKKELKIDKTEICHTTPKKLNNPVKVFGTSIPSPFGFLSLNPEVITVLPTISKIAVATIKLEKQISNNAIIVVQLPINGSKKNTKVFSLTYKHCNKPPPSC